MIELLNNFLELINQGHIISFIFFTNTLLVSFIVFGIYHLEKKSNEREERSYKREETFMKFIAQDISEVKTAHTAQRKEHDDLLKGHEDIKDLILNTMRG